MKDNLHSPRFFFLVFLFLIAGFADLVSANDDLYNLSNFTKNKTGGTYSPEIEYTVWGYTNESYSFYANYKVPSNSFENNATMVFYWDSWNNLSDYDSFPLNDTDHLVNNTTNLEWYHNHTWEKAGLYGVSIGIFELKNGKPTAKNLSYWMPIEIKRNNGPEIEVQDFIMWDENNVSNSTYSSGGIGENEYYCVYVNDHYAFSAVLNASNRTTKVEMDEKIWAEFRWDNEGPADGTRRAFPGERHNYSHEWDQPGMKNVSVRAVKRDFYSGENINSSYESKSMLVIKDPKNFVNSPDHISPFIEPFSNLQNWGIFFVATGLMILFFTYTKNKVPVEISLFGLKPLRLKSVDSFAGIFAFVSGMYLYFVFGRCPWDIPIVGRIDWLSNLYFGMLYHDYHDYSPGIFSGIPFLSILLGLGIVFALSLLIYLVGGPVFKGELKPGKLTGEKDSSAPAQPEPDSYPVEKRMHPEELTALIEREKDPVILRQLYLVRFRYLGDSVEKAASTLGISVGKALNWQETWNKSGYEGFRTERKGENINLQELTTLIENEKDARVLRALYFIRFRSLGNSLETAAFRLGISEETGRGLENIWKERGYEGLREPELEGREG